MIWSGEWKESPFFHWVTSKYVYAEVSWRQLRARILGNFIIGWYHGNLPILWETICWIPFMCPNAWLGTCSNHSFSHIYHLDTKQNIKQQMSLELSQIFLILEPSKLIKASGNWNDLWMFKVAILFTIVLAQTVYIILYYHIDFDQKNVSKKRILFSCYFFPYI